MYGATRAAVCGYTSLWYHGIFHWVLSESLQETGILNYVVTTSLSVRVKNGFMSIDYLAIQHVRISLLPFLYNFVLLFFLCLLAANLKLSWGLVFFFFLFSSFLSGPQYNLGLASIFEVSLDSTKNVFNCAIVWWIVEYQNGLWSQLKWVNAIDMYLGDIWR